MLHMLGFQQNINAASLTSISALLDQVYSKSQSGNYIMNNLNQVIGGSVVGSGLVQAQLDAPSLKSSWSEDLAPIVPATTLQTAKTIDEGGAATYTIRQNDFFIDKVDQPLQLVTGEELRLLVKNGGLTQTYGTLIMADKPPAYANIPTRTIRATFGASTGTRLWELKTLTMPQTLPKGDYALMGAEIVAPNLHAARFVCPNQAFRMGVYPKSYYDDERPYYFRNGWLGEWGRFTNIDLPQIELLDYGVASTGNEVFLDIAKVG